MPRELKLRCGNGAWTPGPPPSRMGLEPGPRQEGAGSRARETRRAFRWRSGGCSGAEAEWPHHTRLTGKGPGREEPCEPQRRLWHYVKSQGAMKAGQERGLITALEQARLLGDGKPGDGSRAAPQGGPGALPRMATR